MENNQTHRQNLKIQIREEYGRLVYTYTTHLKQAGLLTKQNERIKHWQIILSAISTGGFLSAVITSQITLTWISGIVSTALLVLNLYFKEFNLSDDIKEHRTTADALWVIRECYISLLTDFPVLKTEEIMQKRDELLSRTAEIYKAAPSTNPKSYSAAQKALKENEEQFFRTSEIDQMLPEHLREIKEPSQS